MKILNVLILVVTVFGINGCKKFLDRKPLNASLEDLNQGGLEGQAFGLYSAFTDRNSAYHGFNSIPWFAMHSFRDDDAMKGSSPADGADWGVIFDGFQYDKAHWSSSIYWDQKYNLIAKANTLLQTADSLGLADPASEINVAEARFFRAFTYFDLVRVYGEVPKVDFRIYNANDSKIPKSTVTEVYALIDDDLNFAISNLPPNWNNSAGNDAYPGRLTRYTAMALLAKAKLYRQDYGGCLGLCEQIIGSGQYGLLTDYVTNFLVAGENSKESLLEVQANNEKSAVASTGYEYGVEQGVRGSGTWDLGWGWNTPTDNLANAYAAGDKRRAATILFSGQDDGYGKTVPDYPTIPRLYWNKKVYPEPTMQTATGRLQNKWINHSLIRYSDVLLMAAEAANEVGGSGNNSNATTWVNMIRNRAGLGSITYVSQTQMRDAVKQERRFEFAMEGERFFDLVRWNDAMTVLGSLGYNSDCKKYYPLPQAAIDFAGGILVQNPCY
ncbi:MAG TPA: RagB/SusD family nutrient uptake outer membrane protein [Chitinophagaceae bacterium]|nr:RagB/SusD family nutrient uptake outer membrane protein [Chitinophagaceae bacterium]MCB9055152.1 RagB/SusD family nutrient uptake outer membrane protein [Chitinophagales bacterium]HRX92844.1 RagB/SusD family nutrient uptake outer membrane protein [Chitinophagaceae bacterium]